MEVGVQNFVGTLHFFLYCCWLTWVSAGDYCSITENKTMKTITRYFLGCSYVIDATLHCIELIINVLLLFSFFFFVCFTLTKSDKIHHSSLEKMYEQKKKQKKNNSAYFSLFIFEWVVLDKNVKKIKKK